MAKTFIQKLLSDDEGRKLYFREDLIFEVTEAISRAMEEKRVNKAELSRLAGVSKSNITQLLSGDHNMRLTTIADLLYALNSKLEVKNVPIDVDGIQEMFAVNAVDSWIPAKEFMVEGSEYNELRKLKETKQLTQAA
jgi:transcriptional regulator with XRE-family HTH domain